MNTEAKITKATLGFIFSPNLEQVALIQKNRPSWQAGKLNGLGGKCEKGETYTTCLSREVKEESALNIPRHSWQKLGNITWKEWRVAVFATRIEETLVNTARSLTDEKVFWVSTQQLPQNCMTNLHWLIPLARDVLSNNSPPTVTVHY